VATVTEDLVLTAVGLLVLGLVVLVAHVASSAVRSLLPGAADLPEDDRAPAGLGRLVPVGAQLEQEVRAGRAALELWLSTALRQGPGAVPSPRAVPSQRPAPPAERGPGRSTRPALEGADGGDPAGDAG
jgi:hypothetical protein